MYWWGPRFSGERAILGVVSPLKCIRLCKQQMQQQHDAADLSAGDRQHITALEWTHRRGSDKCGGDAASCQNSLTTCIICIHCT